MTVLWKGNVHREQPGAAVHLHDHTEPVILGVCLNTPLTAHLHKLSHL